MSQDRLALGKGQLRVDFTPPAPCWGLSVVEGLVRDAEGSLHKTGAHPAAAAAAAEPRQGVYR